MPIHFTSTDLDARSSVVNDTIFEYLMEPLKANVEIIKPILDGQDIADFLTSSDNDHKMFETLWAFLYGTRRHNSILESEAERDTICKLYQQKPEQIIELIDRLHELVSINTGNSNLDHEIKRYSKVIIDYFTTSKALFDQVAEEHLKPIIESSGKIIANIKKFPKTSGDQAGTTITFGYQIEPKEPIRDLKFYVKTQQNFKIASTSAKRIAISGAGEKTDYRELMIYKILEHTKFGPKCFFDIHPFSRGAILIATQATDFTKTHSPEHKKFLEGSKFKDYQGSFEPRDVLDLNGIDLISRILNITDLNGDNYGRVTINKNSEIASQEEKNKWKIVDFRILDSRDVTDSVYEEFIKTKNNDTFIKSSGSFVEKIIKSPGRTQKQQIATDLVKILEERRGDKKLPFEEAVKISLREISEFLDNPRNKKYLQLRDEAVVRIKEKLMDYAKTVTLNYQAFKERTEEFSRSGK